MNYTLSQLHIFVKVAELQSVTKASEALHLTQPAVSMQLKKLQDQFEVPLTEVVGRRLYVTEFGLEIAREARNILAQVEQLDLKTSAYKGLLTGRLTISIVSTGKYVMPYMLADFVNANPAIDLRMDVTNKADVVRSIKDNSVDFALVSVMPDDLPVESLQLLPNKLYLVGNTSMIDEQRNYSYKVFRETPLIFRERGSGTRRTVEQFLEKNGLPMNVKMELTSNEAVKQAVIAGLGFAIMPLIGLRNAISSKQLQIIPLPNFPIISTWTLIWPKGKKHSPVAKSFLKHLIEHKDGIIKKWFEWYSLHQ